MTRLEFDMKYHHILYDLRTPTPLKEKSSDHLKDLHKLKLCSHCTGQVCALFQKLLRYNVNKNRCFVAVQKLFRSVLSVNTSHIRHTICNAPFCFENIIYQYEVPLHVLL